MTVISLLRGICYSYYTYLSQLAARNSWLIYYAYISPLIATCPSNNKLLELNCIRQFWYYKRKLYLHNFSWSEWSTERRIEFDGSNGINGSGSGSGHRYRIHRIDNEINPALKKGN